MADRTAIVEKVRETTERVGSDRGLEVVDVQMLGGGGTRVLRIFIDKPEGVTHADRVYLAECRHHPGRGRRDSRRQVYAEVSSPGVERKLAKPKEFERFVGHKVKVVLRQPRRKPENLGSAHCGVRRRNRRARTLSWQERPVPPGTGQGRISSLSGNPPNRSNN